MEDLASILAGLQKKRARSVPFVRLLVAGLCGNPKTTANSQALINLLQQADLGDSPTHRMFEFQIIAQSDAPTCIPVICFFLFVNSSPMICGKV
jgi:hypothetical protein